MSNETGKIDPLIVQVYMLYMKGNDLNNIVVANLTRYSQSPGTNRVGKFYLVKKETWDEVTDEDQTEGTLQEFLLKGKWKNI